MIYIRDIVFKNSFDSHSYLNRLPVVKYLDAVGKITLTKSVTFFVGENGTGKSTLLEGIAGAYGFNGEGGSKNFYFSTYKNTSSELYKNLTLTKVGYPKDGFFLRAESLYNVATNIDKLGVVESYGGTSLHEQSHGESFLALVKNRFIGNGFYILDEPEAALSPMRLLTLIAEINTLVNENSQFIIATHSPILMAFPNAQILEFSSDGIKETGYRETEHYKITKDFINDPERMLHYLLGD